MTALSTSIPAPLPRAHEDIYKEADAIGLNICKYVPRKYVGGNFTLPPKKVASTIIINHPRRSRTRYNAIMYLRTILKLSDPYSLYNDPAPDSITRYEESLQGAADAFLNDLLTTYYQMLNAN